MTPVEKLEAAIAKLEKERDAGVPAPWFLTYQDAYHPRVWGNADENDADPVVQAHGRGNAELIVTLHRTIDAQLDFLRTARGVAGAGLTGDFAELMAEHGLQLADSILGGA